MNLDPISFTVDRLYSNLKMELVNIFSSCKEGVPWFCPEVWLSYPNPNVENVISCIKRYKKQDLTTYFSVLFLTEISNFSGNPQEIEMVTIALFSFIFHVIPQPINDTNSSLIFSQILTRPFFSKFQSLLYTYVGPFIQSTMPYCNYMDDIIETIIETVDSDNLTFFVRLLKVSMITSDSLLSLLNRFVEILNVKDDLLQSRLIVGLSRVLICFSAENQKEYRESIEKANIKHIRTLFKSLYANKNENSGPILAFLLPFYIVKREEISKEELKIASHAISYIKKFSKNKKKLFSFLGAFTLCNCFLAAGDLVIDSFNKDIEKTSKKLLSCFKDEKLMKQFPAYIQYFMEYDFMKTGDPENVMESEEFSKIIYFLAKNVDNSVIIKNFKGMIRNNVLSCITELVNFPEAKNDSTDDEGSKDGLEIVKQKFMFAFNTFYAPTSLQLIVDCQNTNGVKYHSITETPKEMCLFFSVFDTLQTIQHLIGLIIQLFKTRSSRIQSNIALLVRNIFIPFDKWFDVLKSADIFGISAFLFNITQNFLSLFTSINKPTYDMKEHILTYYIEFLSWIKVIIFDNVCKDAKEDEKKRFAPLITCIHDILLVIKAIFGAITPEWLLKVNEVNKDLTEFVLSVPSIAPSDNAWKEILKLPFKNEEMTIPTLNLVLPLINFKSNAIDEFRHKYENIIFSDANVEIPYLKTAEMCVMPFSEALLQSMHKKINQMLTGEIVRSRAMTMNIMIAASSVVENQENAKIECCGELCIEFLMFLITDSNNSEFKRLAFNAMNFVQSVSDNISFSYKSRIISLSCDVILTHLSQKTSVTVIKTSLHALGKLLHNFKFRYESSHISLYDKYIKARESCIFTLHTLRSAGNYLLSSNETDESVSDSFMTILENNFLLCSDIYYQFLSTNDISQLMYKSLSILNVDMIKNYDVVINDNSIQTPFFTFNFIEALLDENANSTYMNAAIDFVWCYNQQKALLKYIIEKSNEKTKSPFFSAYCKRCSMDMDHRGLIDSFKKMSIIDFMKNIHLNNEFVFFLSQFGTTKSQIGIFCSFFVLMLLGNPISFGINETVDKNNAIAFVDSLTKSSKFVKFFEAEMQKSVPFIHTPNTFDAMTTALKILPYGQSINYDSLENTSSAQGKINPEHILGMTESGFLMPIKDKKNAWLFVFSRLDNKYIDSLAAFVLSHTNKKCSASFVVDFEGAFIEEITGIYKQVSLIWEGMNGKIDQIYTLNLTRNAATFLNEFSSEEWTTKVVLLTNPNDIFNVFPTLILPSYSLEIPRSIIPIQMKNVNNAVVKIKENGFVIEADAEVLDTITKKCILMRYELINRMSIKDNVIETEYNGIEGFCQFSVNYPSALSCLVSMEKQILAFKKKLPQGINMLFSPAATISAIIKLLDASSHIVGAAAANAFHKLSIKNQIVEFVGSKLAYPSQQWAIKHLWSSQYALESFIIFCEMNIDDPIVSYFIGIGSHYLSDDDLAYTVQRLSRNGFKPEIWSEIPPEKAKIVLIQSVYCANEFPASIAKINVDAIRDYLKYPHVPHKMMESAIKSIPEAIIESPSIPDGFEAFIFAFCLKMVAKSENILPYYTLSECAALKKDCSFPPIYKTSQYDGVDINELIGVYRRICIKNGCVDEFDSEFSGKKDPLSILCRSVFEDDKDKVANDAIYIINEEIKNEYGFLLSALDNVLSSRPERAKEFVHISLNVCCRDVRTGLSLLNNCFRIDPTIVDDHAEEIIAAIQPFFVNRLTVNYALETISVILETQKLSLVSSDLIHTPLIPFASDDIVPFNVKLNAFSVKFLFKSLVVGQLSVKQTNRTLDYLISDTDELEPIKIELIDEIILRLSNATSIETGKKLTTLLGLLTQNEKS